METVSSGHCRSKIYRNLSVSSKLSNRLTDAILGVVMGGGVA